MEQTSPLRVPQINVNDDTVLLVRWSVPQYAQVAPGDTVCEVETSKASAEVTAERGGVLAQSAMPPVRVRIGDIIGAIAPTRDAAEAYLAAPPRATTIGAQNPATQATPKAKALAERHGLSLDAIAEAGIHGTIKESDVLRFLERPTARQKEVSGLTPPAGLARYVESAGPMSAFDAAVAANLRRSTNQLLLTSVDADCRLTAAHRVIREALGGGRMTSVLHLIIASAGRVLPRYPRLMSFAHEGELYRYRSVDIAFVARAADGRLYTPVVRAVDRTDLGQIAGACQAALLRVMRGTVTVDDLEGSCFTISHVPVPGTTRVAALPSFGQSAILGVSAERKSLALVDGAAVEQSIVTLTLSYDHAVCDGVYAASFLADLTADLEAPAP